MDHSGVERAKRAELEEALPGNDDERSSLVGQVDELGFERLVRQGKRRGLGGRERHTFST